MLKTNGDHPTDWLVELVEESGQSTVPHDVRRHVEGCGVCQQELTELRSTMTELADVHVSRAYLERVVTAAIGPERARAVLEESAGPVPVTATALERFAEWFRPLVLGSSFRTAAVAIGIVAILAYPSYRGFVDMWRPPAKVGSGGGAAVAVVLEAEQLGIEDGTVPAIGKNEGATSYLIVISGAYLDDIEADGKYSIQAKDEHGRTVAESEVGTGHELRRLASPRTRSVYYPAPFALDPGTYRITLRRVDRPEDTLSGLLRVNP